ncbi:MAG: carbohydrate binding domain-containing protein, partial [Ruminococcus sp.]|nr:carbohydrate binding domain-containing protein [Ruminococcus sp.]
INKGNTEITQAFTIGSGEKITDVDRYRTSASENLAKTENMDNDGSGFFSQLPANSVSTFVISLDGESSGGNTNPTNPPAATPDENGYYFHDTFETGNDGWEAHGTAELTMSGRIPCKDTNALLVQGREKSWNGVQKKLDSSFKGGQEYSFSVCATYVDGSETQTMKLSLQYTDAAGETKFANIANGVTAKNQYVQLVNKNFKLPEGSDYVIYVETADGNDNFYIDEAIAAVGGTEIKVHHSPVLPEPTTEAPTKEPVQIPADDFIAGDVNHDGRVDTFDLVAMRKGILTSFADSTAKAAADVNNDGENNIADLLLLSEYLLGQNSHLQKSESLQDVTTPSAKMRTISEYTPIVAANISEYETDDSKTEKPGVNYGTLEKKSYYSNFCGRDKKYNVLLPANYDESKKYPVLYVMHGYWEDQDRMILTGNDHIPTQQIIGNAIAEGAAKEMIVVFPYIYSSQTQDNCSAMDDANNQAYDNFDTVLTTELMPLIESEYSVATGRENTAITGFSMGGREALMIGQKHPDLFGYMGAICAAPGATGAFKFASEEEAPSLIFLTAGSNDETVFNTPEGYHNSFTTNGVPHIWHYVNGGYHGDNCIRTHIYNFIRAIFKA